MLPTEQLEHYANLLRTRQAAARRNAILVGGLFAVAILAALWLNLTAEPNGRSAFFNLTMLVLFGLGSVSTWSRWETIKEMAELTDELRAAGQAFQPAREGG